MDLERKEANKEINEKKKKGQVDDEKIEDCLKQVEKCNLLF